MAGNGQQPIVIVDASNILHRAYNVALTFDPSASAEKGITLATGMVRKYLRLLGVESRRCMLVCESGETWRKAIYPEYKANRKKERAEELHTVLSTGPSRIMEETGIRLVGVPGFEADDVIATYADLLDHEYYRVYIVSGDKDLLQCVTGQVSVYLLGQSNWAEYDPPTFRAKYGFSAPLLADYKALVGDKSDNIGGVNQIGEVTARKLLIAFPGIEKMYAALDDGWAGSTEIKPAAVEHLKAGREIALRNLILTTVKRDVPGVALKN